MMKPLPDRVENITGKKYLLTGFSPFLIKFLTVLFMNVVKSRDGMAKH